MIRLFLLGFKGYYLIRNLPNEYLKNIDCVIIAKDPNITNDYFNETKNECIKRNVSFFERKFEPQKLVDYFVMVGWRWIVPLKKGTKLIVFHDSLLPKYRGFNPLVTALINGDTKIGATCLFASREYDDGDIIDQKSIDILYPVKIRDAIELMSKIYLELFIKVADSINLNTLKSYPQDNLKATYSLWRNEDDYFINWNWDANKIERFVNAVGFPYLGAKSFINEKVVLIKELKAVSEDVIIENRDSGKVLFKNNGILTVVCGKGLVSIQELYNEDGSIYNLEGKFRIKFK